MIEGLGRVFSVSFGFVYQSTLQQNLFLRNKKIDVCEVERLKKSGVLIGRNILYLGCLTMSHDGHFTFYF